VVKTVAELRYDFSMNIITRKRQQAKRAVISWCKGHGLQNASVRDVAQGCGWTSFSVFSSYLHKQNYLILKSGDTERAFGDLIDVLRKTDEKMRIKTSWQSLEKYIQLESEVATWKSKLAQTETDLNSEEDKLSRESVVHETENFDADDEILYRGEKEEITKHLKT
jgi:hypothetical protein